MGVKDKARIFLDLNRKLCVTVEAEKWHLAVCGSRLRSGGLYKALPDSTQME